MCFQESEESVKDVRGAFFGVEQSGVRVLVGRAELNYEVFDVNWFCFVLFEIWVCSDLK